MREATFASDSGVLFLANCVAIAVNALLSHDLWSAARAGGGIRHYGLRRFGGGRRVMLRLPGADLKISLRAR